MWRRRILATNKLYLRCTLSIKVAQWGKSFVLLAIVNIYAEWSKAGAQSLVVSLPRQSLAIEVSPGLSVVSPTTCRSDSQHFQDYCVQLLRIVECHSYLSSFCFHMWHIVDIRASWYWSVEDNSPFTMGYSFHQPTYVMLHDDSGWP